MRYTKNSLDTQITFLKNILQSIVKNKSSDFSGVGLILYDRISEDNFSPLQKNEDFPNLPFFGSDEIASYLVSISNVKNQFHDGFHLISKDLALTHLSYYISPQISKHVEYSVGARFRTAQLGSYLEEVIAVGIIGNDYKIKIFVNGKIVYS